MNADLIIAMYDAKLSSAEETTRDINSKPKDYNLQEIEDYIVEWFANRGYNLFDSKSIDTPNSETYFGSVVIYEYYNYGYWDIVGLTQEDFLMLVKKYDPDEYQSWKEYYENKCKDNNN